MEVVLAGVAPVEFYDNNHNLYATATALTDGGLNVAVSEDVQRGGANNARIGSYFYDSNLGLKLTNTTFKLEYLATKLGSAIEAGGDVWELETITTTVANTITVTKTPVAPFDGVSTIYGYYKLASSTTDAFETITFTGSSATVSNLPIGSVVCVKYCYTNSGARKFKVNSSIIPNISYAIMRIPENVAGTSKEVYTASSSVGELLVKIPKFQFDPNTDLALTSSGHASMDLSGNALINYGSGCSAKGYYAEIVENIFGKGTFDTVTNIMVEGSSDGFDIGVGDTETLNIYAKYSDGTSITKLDNSLFTFTSSAVGVATAGAHTGVVTGIGAGDCVITVTATTAPTLETNVSITVA